jgi:hypothetical protein
MLSHALEFSRFSGFSRFSRFMFSVHVLGVHVLGVHVLGGSRFPAFVFSSGFQLLRSSSRESELRELNSTN